MTTIAYSPVNIQTSALSVPSIPAWFGEITLMAHYLHHQGVLAAIEEQVRFARRRRAVRLCDQRRTDAGRLLRADGALGRHVHGALWTRPFACPFDTQPLSRRA